MRSIGRSGPGTEDARVRRRRGGAGYRHLDRRVLHTVSEENASPRFFVASPLTFRRSASVAAPGAGAKRHTRRRRWSRRPTPRRARSPRTRLRCTRCQHRTRGPQVACEFISSDFRVRAHPPGQGASSAAHLHVPWSSRRRRMEEPRSRRSRVHPASRPRPRHRRASRRREVGVAAAGAARDHHRPHEARDRRSAATGELVQHRATLAKRSQASTDLPVGRRSRAVAQDGCVLGDGGERFDDDGVGLDGRTREEAGVAAA